MQRSKYNVKFLLRTCRKSFKDCKNFIEKGLKISFNENSSSFIQSIFEEKENNFKKLKIEDNSDVIFERQPQ